MKAKIIAILMVAICSFTAVNTANAQRAHVTVQTPGAAVHVDNGRGGFHNGQRFDRGNRYSRRHGNFNRYNGRAYQGNRMQARRVWVPGHRSRGHWVPGHFRMVRR
jgi:hypothetical protein